MREFLFYIRNLRFLSCGGLLRMRPGRRCRQEL